MTMGYYDDAVRRVASDESVDNAGTLEQDTEWDRDDDEALSGSLFPVLDPDTLVGLVCAAGIAVLAIGAAAALVMA